MPGEYNALIEQVIDRVGEDASHHPHIDHNLLPLVTGYMRVALEDYALRQRPAEPTAREPLAEELASSMTDRGDYWHVPHDVGQRFVDAILYDRT